MSALPDTLSGAAAALAQGKISSVELTRALLQRISSAADLNAFLHVNAEAALAQAQAADARLKQSDSTALTGIPVAIKDNFCVAGEPTTAASKMLGNWRPPYDADLVQRLAQAGAVIIGKTNMDEFAMGASGENSAFGATGNPWSRAHVPGGSSSGSAAALAAGLAIAAVGTDTGGSVRQPSAHCGLTSIKPTYGRMSRWGMIAYASSLDQAGLMAWCAEDLAHLMQELAGPDARDSTCADAPVPDYSANLQQPVTGKIIGIPDDKSLDMVQPPILEVLQQTRKDLEAAGVSCRPVTLPLMSLGICAYHVLARAEASTNLARYDGVRFGHRCDQPRDLHDLYCRSRAEGFGGEVKRRIIAGTYVLSVGYYDAFYRTAQKIRRMIRDEFLAILAQVDAILLPTVPTLPPRFGSPAEQLNVQDQLTAPASLAGLPSLSMPAGRVDGLPTGMQLVAAHFNEPLLLQLAAAYQRQTNHHQARPDGYPEPGT